MGAGNHITNDSVREKKTSGDFYIYDMTGVYDSGNGRCDIRFTIIHGGVLSRRMTLWTNYDESQDVEADVEFVKTIEPYIFTEKIIEKVVIRGVDPSVIRIGHLSSSAFQVDLTLNESELTSCVLLLDMSSKWRQAAPAGGAGIVVKSFESSASYHWFQCFEGYYLWAREWAHRSRLTIESDIDPSEFRGVELGGFEYIVGEGCSLKRVGVSRYEFEIPWSYDPAMTEYADETVVAIGVLLEDGEIRVDVPCSYRRKFKASE